MQNNYSEKKAGLPPGSLVHVGQQRMDKIIIDVHDYNADQLESYLDIPVLDAFKYKDNANVSWINIHGLHDTKSIKEIGSHFGLTELVIEDVLDTTRRPAAEDFPEGVFVSLKMLGIDPVKKQIVSEHISICLGDTWILSFQEQVGDLFDTLRHRLKNPSSKARQKTAHYLFYRLIDILIDNYYYITDYFGDAIDKLEEELLSSTPENEFKNIQSVKRNLIKFKKVVSSTRETLTGVLKTESVQFDNEMKAYFKDTQDHINQLLENIDSQRELINGVNDLNNSIISNRTNQVMQMLTIVSTIFIPLTFIAGIYGMNFEIMPELKWEYGYAMAWGFMVTVGISLVVYFKRKGWL